MMTPTAVPDPKILEIDIFLDSYKAGMKNLFNAISSWCDKVVLVLNCNQICTLEKVANGLKQAPPLVKLT